MKEHYKNV